MSQVPIIVIAGWGHCATAMSGIYDSLKSNFRIIPVSTHDLALRGNAAIPQLHSGQCSRGTPLPRKDAPTEWGGYRTYPKTDILPSPDCTSPYAAGLYALIREQGGEVAIIGWSMGGIVALEMVWHYPELVSRLVLISVTSRFCSCENYPHAVPVRTIRAMILGLRRDTKKTLAGFYQLAAAPYKELLPAVHDQLAQVSGWRDELATGLTYLMNSDLRCGLGRIHAPVLMLHGRQDRVIPWQAAEAASRGLPDSRLCLYDDFGHDLPLREPARLTDEIRRWLE